MTMDMYSQQSSAIANGQQSAYNQEPQQFQQPSMQQQDLMQQQQQQFQQLPPVQQQQLPPMQQQQESMQTVQPGTAGDGQGAYGASVDTSNVPNVFLQGQAGEKLKEIVATTGYSFNVTPKQRKYGGPPPGWTGSLPGAGHELFLGGIPKYCFENKIIPICQQFGRIFELRLMMNSMSEEHKGFCFVTYCEKADADRAVKGLNNYEIMPGRRIEAKVNQQKTRLFVGNIPKSKLKSEIQAEFSKVTEGLLDVIVYKNALEPQNANRGFAFLDYDCNKTAIAAERYLSTPGVTVFRRNLIVSWAEAQEEPDEEIMSTVKALYVRGISADVSEAMLKEAFSAYGVISSFKRIQDYAFIHYNSRDVAMETLHNLNGQKIGNATLDITLAKPMPRKTVKPGMGRGGMMIRPPLRGGPPPMMRARGPPPLMRGMHERPPARGRGGFVRPPPPPARRPGAPPPRGLPPRAPPRPYPRYEEADYDMYDPYRRPPPRAYRDPYEDPYAPRYEYDEYDYPAYPRRRSPPPPPPPRDWAHRPYEAERRPARPADPYAGYYAAPKSAKPAAAASYAEDEFVIDSHAYGSSAAQQLPPASAVPARAAPPAPAVRRPEPPAAAEPLGWRTNGQSDTGYAAGESAYAASYDLKRAAPADVREPEAKKARPTDPWGHAAQPAYRASEEERWASAAQPTAARSQPSAAASYAPTAAASYAPTAASYAAVSDYASAYGTQTATYTPPESRPPPPPRTADPYAYPAATEAVTRRY